MSNYVLVNEKDKCSGCGLCMKACSSNAISMREDDAGFSYPYIDKDKCIDCGKCKRICEYNSSIKRNKEPIECFAATSKKDEILNSTASGGAFSTIAEIILKKGGVVYGASLEHNSVFCVNHLRIDKIEDLDLLKGSKYSQSCILNVYEQVKKDILDGKKVLFSGTPCQVSAIKKYIGKSPDLYTIDIICHGVPNNKFFNDYIEFVDNKNNIEIKDFKFRDKSKGWGLYYYYYYYYDTKKHNYYSKTEPAYKSSYYQLFLDSFTFRINCYSCPYANEKRVGDITLGDYWGIEQEHPELLEYTDLKKGISCLLVNSKKGERLVEDSRNDLILINSSLDKIKKHNTQLSKPCLLNHERENIIRDYIDNGYDAIDKFYRKKYGKTILLKNIWLKIPKKVRRIIKRNKEK